MPIEKKPLLAVSRPLIVRQVFTAEQFVPVSLVFAEWFHCCARASLNRMPEIDEHIWIYEYRGTCSLGALFFCVRPDSSYVRNMNFPWHIYEPLLLSCPQPLSQCYYAALGYDLFQLWQSVGHFSLLESHWDCLVNTNGTGHGVQSIKMCSMAVSTERNNQITTRSTNVSFISICRAHRRSAHNRIRFLRSSQ